MVLYDLNEQDNSVTLRICANSIHNDPIIIVDAYKSLRIIVEQDACVTIIDASYGLDQQVQLSVASGGVLNYCMNGVIEEEKRYMRSIHSIILQNACLAVISSLRCIGFFSLQCTALLNGVKAHFFSGSTIIVFPHGTYEQKIVQKHVYQQAISESRLYGIVEEMGTLQNNGLIIVEKNGIGSVAEHTTKCLTAGKSTKIKAKPMLEIAARDVFVKHGAATAPLDGSLLYSLYYRGIMPNQAKSLLKRAFLAQIHDFWPVWVNQRAKAIVELFF